MSYTETKTLEVKYVDHRFKLYIDGVAYSNDVKLKDGTRIYVEPIEEEKIKEIDVNVNVNTKPFDKSVNRCGVHIGTLTGSIVGFKAADVTSKIENEKLIVNRVTAGFSSMIEQHLTLQNVGKEAEMHALAGELVQQCKELEHKHDVMSKDFNRIKSRYTSLFDTLNKELNNRIKQLIKPCFDFVSQVRQEQNRRIETSLLSIATTTGKESDSARIAIQTSKMKGNAETLISTARNFIIGNKSLNKARELYFTDKFGPNSTYYTPAILCYSNDDSSPSNFELFINPIIDGHEDIKKSLLNASSSLHIKDINLDVKKRIGDYYNQMLLDISDGSDRGQRVTALMKSFFNKNTLKTFVN